MEVSDRRDNEGRLAALGSRARPARNGSIATVAEVPVATPTGDPHSGQDLAASESSDLQVSQRTMILTLYYGCRSFIGVFAGTPQIVDIWRPQRYPKFRKQGFVHRIEDYRGMSLKGRVTIHTYGALSVLPHHRRRGCVG